MKVIEITVSDGCTFSNPHESYANLKPFVTLKAALTDGDDVDACAKELQAKAYQLLAEHKELLLRMLAIKHKSLGDIQLWNVSGGMNHEE